MLLQTYLGSCGNITAFLGHWEISYMADVTFYAFKSNVRYFLSSLLKDPIKTKINDFLSELGFTKQKLINILLKRDVIRRHEKIDDKDKENGNINYVVKYNVVRKQFERKLKRIYNKYVESPKKSDSGDVEESTGCCGVGAPSKGFFGYDKQAFEETSEQPIRRSIYGESKISKKRIFITEGQFEMLKETLSTEGAGNYGYDVPFPVKKGDPTLVHRKKGGISMGRLKK